MAQFKELLEGKTSENNPSQEVDLLGLEKLTRESLIVRSFQGVPPLTPPPAPRIAQELVQEEESAFLLQE